MHCSLDGWSGLLPLITILAALPLTAALALGGSGASLGNPVDVLPYVNAVPSVTAVSTSASVQSGRILPMHTKASCDRQMNAGAKVCSRLRPLQAAAICHAANMAHYAGCLAGASG